LISVDLEKDVADPQGGALVMGGDDFDLYLVHISHYCGLTTDVAWSGRVHRC
jgi:hypothetical protein